MKELELKNQELWYSKDPNKGSNLDKIIELGKSNLLSPIIIYTSDNFIGSEEEGNIKYVIIDGNKRAFIYSNFGKRTKARLLETDKDLQTIKKELESEHDILIRDISTLKQLDEFYLDKLEFNYVCEQPIYYGLDVE